MTTSGESSQLRAKLVDARLMLIFTPELCTARDPLELLEATLPSIDVIQVRVKSRSAAGSMTAPTGARQSYDWCLRVLDLLANRRRFDVPVIVNDRVDVAAALWSRGCAGVHLGQDDCGVTEARAVLGPAPLVGLSTHDRAQVTAAGRVAVDYLGFGPINETTTKGYARGLGAQACDSVQREFSGPIFPIGGITLSTAGELAAVGRAAVGAAILCAEDPAAAAQELRRLLAGAAGASAMNIASP